MNKIYKLIWSKVRNCYVAVSEIAKRNGKVGDEVELVLQILRNGAVQRDNDTAVQIGRAHV